MANLKVSELNELFTLEPLDSIPIIDDSEVDLSLKNKRFTIATLTSFINTVADTSPLLNKGDIYVFDGTSNVPLPVGADGQILSANSAESTGLEWINFTGSGEANTASNLGAGEGLFASKVAEDLQFKSLVAGTNITLDVAADTITVNSSGGGGGGGGFTSLRVDMTGDLTLTPSTAHYIYLDPQGSTYDVVLTDPPNTDDFFYIVNRTGNGEANIKETSTSSTAVTLDNINKVAQCHYDGTEWIIIVNGAVN